MPKSKVSLEEKTTVKNSEVMHSLLMNLKQLFANTVKFRPKSYTSILVALLVIASFLIGVLFTKVQYLEKNQAQNAQAQQAAGTQNAAAPALAKQPNLNVGNFPAQGEKNAKIKIVEFADYRCPFCEQFFKEVIPPVITDYVNTGKAAFYFRNFAFLGDASVVAANATECANEQGKFWDMHDYLYKNQPSESDTSMYNTDTLTTAAGTLGLNTDQFRSCLSSNKYQKNVDTDKKEGEAAGVTGTPTTFINGNPIVGACPVTTVKSAIDAEINGKDWSVDGNCQLAVK